ncbi:hypothetical protein FE257_003827 [Aspergillus nanangensis]|uniref:Cucumopine synthase C-terminal helical bundle domain-containing protein n=1 Tax=Aspergillus nanangensis TaxID=2582783 RepID=A0AAD4CCC9_ASPNN|nr:hypothetical protein FE257_003827 [Aspergillus nanangensis]
MNPVLGIKPALFGVKLQFPSQRRYDGTLVSKPAADVTITLEMNAMNPEVIDLLWDTLPYRSLQTHALVTGDHLYHLVPSEALIHLAIKYGTVTEHHPAAPCGNVVPADLEKLRLVGDEIWKGQLGAKKAFEVVVWDASEPEPDAQSLCLRLQRPGVTEEVKSLVNEIHHMVGLTFSSCPGPSRLQGLLFRSDGLLQQRSESHMGYYVFDNILKVAATRPDFTLQQLIALYRDFVPTTAEFLGYVGHAFLRDSNRKIANLISLNVETNPNQAEAREDFLAMVSVLAQYINLLNAQNLCLFPWRHTVEYPILKE